MNSTSRVTAIWATVLWLLLVLALQNTPRGAYAQRPHDGETPLKRMGRRVVAPVRTPTKGSKKVMKKARERKFRTNNHFNKPPLVDRSTTTKPDFFNNNGCDDNPRSG